jgi:hypothetical protein
MQRSGNLVETTEQDRVKLYQRGWNDAALGRGKLEGEPIMYYAGYLDALRGGDVLKPKH